MKKSKEKNYILFKITSDDTKDSLKELEDFSIDTNSLIPVDKNIIIVICNTEKRIVNTICKVEHKDKINDDIAEIVATKTLIKGKQTKVHKPGYKSKSVN